MKHAIAAIAILLLVACSSNRVVVHDLDQNTITTIEQDSINSIRNIVSSHADEDEVMHFYSKAPTPKDTLYCEIPKETAITICDQSVQNLTTLVNGYIQKGFEISAGLSNPSAINANEYCVIMSR